MAAASPMARSAQSLSSTAGLLIRKPLRPPSANSAYLIRPKYGAINVWIGTADGYVYRDNVSVTDRAGAGSTLTLAVNFSKFGEEVHVNVPAASATLDIGKLGG